MERTYIAIDLKSFYASVECVDRGLDPLRANLVVADESRTNKTICLAVSPALKARGVPGRPRLFELEQKVKEINKLRLSNTPNHLFAGSSTDDLMLRTNPCLKIDYLVAKPRMARYMEVSRQIYAIYLRYVAPEDMHIYSVDEVFIDTTDYLRPLSLTGRQFAEKIVDDVLQETGITATVGVATNLFLCKVAMDIKAKRIPPDAKGVRIAELDEMSFRREFWAHRPLTDFWRIGKGTADSLATYGIYCMGDIARQSVSNEELLYKLFGINAELLIDHAWGWEPCRISDIKSYHSGSRSLSSGQVLKIPYSAESAALVVREMTDLLVLDLVEKRLVTDQIVLTVGYDIENLLDPVMLEKMKGQIETDRFGRILPKNAHGSINLGKWTSSTRVITDAVMQLYDRIINDKLTVRRMYVVANHVVSEDMPEKMQKNEQFDLFTDYRSEETKREEEEKSAQKERIQQEAIIGIKRKFGKNSIIKGMNLQKDSTTIERNRQVGGHNA